MDKAETKQDKIQKTEYGTDSYRYRSVTLWWPLGFGCGCAVHLVESTHKNVPFRGVWVSLLIAASEAG
jgi:hypothetical protein